MDFNLPERFGTTYVAPSGEKLAPVMLHRALFGSLERFTGILIKHNAGHLLLWPLPCGTWIAGAARHGLVLGQGHDTVSVMVPGRPRENRETGAGLAPNSGAAPATVSGVCPDKATEPKGLGRWGVT